MLKGVSKKCLCEFIRTDTTLTETPLTAAYFVRLKTHYKK